METKRVWNKELVNLSLTCETKRFIAGDYHSPGVGLAPRLTDPGKLAKRLIETWAPVAATGAIDVARGACYAAWEDAGRAGLATGAEETPYQAFEAGVLICEAALRAVAILKADPGQPVQPANRPLIITTPAPDCQQPVYWGSTAYKSQFLHFFRAYSTFGGDDALDIANDLSWQGEMAIQGQPEGCWVHPIIIGRRAPEGYRSPLVRAWRDPFGTLCWANEWIGPDGRTHRPGKDWHSESWDRETLGFWLPDLLGGKVKPGEYTSFPSPIFVRFDQRRLDQFLQMLGTMDQRLNAGVPILNYKACLRHGRCEFYDVCWGSDPERARKGFVPYNWIQGGVSDAKATG